MADLSLESLLAFESKWWQLAGRKDAAIREAFGISPIRYAQVLNLAINTDEAARVDPVTTRRLRSLRGQASGWRRAG